MKQLFSFKNLFLVAILAILASCNSTRKSIGIEEGWELLGERKVNFIRDKDDIPVESKNEFTALRFKVEDRDIRINYLKIYFKNGDVLQPNVDETIGANQTSREIELAREGRTIDKIEFKYRTVGGNLFDGRANVLIFGKKQHYPRGY